MKQGLFSIALLCMLIHVTHAQSDETYDFKPVHELKRQKGLQDPFIKPDGERINTKEEWAEQREYIKAMLEHSQGEEDIIALLDFTDFISGTSTQ